MTLKTRQVNDIDKLVSERLKNLRIRRGLSRYKLGKVLNISQKQIQKYEDGINRIACGKLHSLSVFFNISLNYFFSKKDTNLEELKMISPLKVNIAREISSYMPLEKTIYELIRAYAAIPKKETRKRVLILIESMRD